MPTITVRVNGENFVPKKNGFNDIRSNKIYNLQTRAQCAYKYISYVYSCKK